jgi:ribosomal protein S1
MVDDEVWKNVESVFKLGDVVSGIIRVKRPFGIFIALQGGHIGLIPIILLADTPEEGDELWLNLPVGAETKGIVVQVDHGARNILLSRRSEDLQLYGKMAENEGF